MFDKYGIRASCLDWIKSYLSNRKQILSYNNCNSSQKDIICGVPHGSILGPLLFLIYVNDTAYVSSLLCFNLFADDTNLFLAQTLPNLYRSMNSDMNKIVEWLNVNQISPQP